MAHTRIRKFNTKETYPEQSLDNDLCQAVVAGNTIYLRGQCPQELDGAKNIDCPSRILMQPLEDNNDEAPEPLEIRQPDPVRPTVTDDRPAHPGPKTGGFAMDDSSPDTTKAVA